MTFSKLDKLNDEIATEYEALQATKRNVFASIHARHEELHEAMEFLAKTMEANTDDDDIDEVMESLVETKVMERNDIDDQLDAISNELDELLRSMEE